MGISAVIPIKAFGLAKRRLAGDLSTAQRSALAKATAARTVTACLAAGLATTVVTDDAGVAEEVATWGATTTSDPGRGLDAAVGAGVAAVGSPWVVVHGDLPLLDAVTMSTAAQIVAAGGAVIAPARDSGTNILGSSRPIRFAYGPGSFHRHLAALGASHPHVIVSATAALELDTIADLRRAALLPGGEWLVGFLS